MFGPVHKNRRVNNLVCSIVYNTGNEILLSESRYINTLTICWVVLGVLIIIFVSISAVLRVV